MDIPEEDFKFLELHEAELKAGYRRGDPFSVAVIGLSKAVQSMKGEYSKRLGHSVLLGMLSKACAEWKPG